MPALSLPLHVLPEPGPAATPAIHTEGVRHAFGDVVALDGVDLEVEAGTVFGLLGPNGAGKTTLVRILSTLLRPSAGRARVLGFDVIADALGVRRRLGSAGQLAAVDGRCVVAEIGVPHRPRAAYPPARRSSGGADLRPARYAQEPPVGRRQTTADAAE